MSIINSGLLNKIKKTLNNEGSGWLTTIMNLNGEAWSEWEDSEHWVTSPWLDVIDKNFMILATRDNFDPQITDLQVEGMIFTSTSMSPENLDLYTPAGEELNSIPQETHSGYESGDITSLKSWVIIDVSQSRKVRFKYKSTVEHTGSNYMQYVYMLMGKNVLEGLTAKMKINLDDINDALDSHIDTINTNVDTIKKTLNNKGSDLLFTYQDLNGEAWDEWEDSEHWVNSPWLDVIDKNFMVLYTNDYSSEITDMQVEGSAVGGENDNAEKLNIYTPDGEVLDSIPKHSNHGYSQGDITSSKSWVIIDISQSRRVRFKFKSDTEPDEDNKMGFAYILTSKNVFEGLTTEMKNDLDDIKADINREMAKLVRYDSENLFALDRAKLDEILSPSGIPYSNSGNVWSGYIPAKPNTTYYRNPVDTTSGDDFHRKVWYYDKDKNIVGDTESSEGDGRAKIFTTHADTYYIGLTVRMEGTWDFRGKLKITEGLPWELIKENDDFKYSKLLMGDRIMGIHNDYVMAWGGEDELWFTQNGIDDWSEKETLTVNDDNFPNIIGTSPFLPDNYWKAIFFESYDNGHIICLILTSTNQVYYSDVDDDWTDFQESTIWNLPGDEHKPVLHESYQNQKIDSWEFYPTSNPEDRGRMFKGMNSPVWQPGTGLCFCNYLGAVDAPSGVPSSVFYTTNGEDIYIIYQFGINGRKVKKAGTEYYHTESLYKFGDDLDTSGFNASYSSGFNIKRRIPIVPSSSDTEPTDIFEFQDTQAVSAFTKGNPAVCTVNDGSAFAEGDVVLFEHSGGDLGNDWDDLANDTAGTNPDTTDPVGGTGMFLIVKSVNGNDLTIAETVGNPNNNLTCRHIHCINESLNGIVVGTGEHYPHSWILYIKGDIQSPYGYEGSRWYNSVRLTSTTNSIERPLGSYIRSDGKIVFASDTHGYFDSGLDVRTDESLEMIGAGVYVGDLADIDNKSAFEGKLLNVSTAYNFRVLGNALFFSGHDGETYISFDKGDTWRFINNDRDCKQYCLGFDKNSNRWFFSCGGNEMFAIELK